MAVRGVLFDVDDTLFDYAASERAGVLGQLAAQGLLERFASPDAAHELWTAIMVEEYEHFLTGRATWTEQRRQRVLRFLGHLDLVPAEGLTEHQTASWFAGYEVHRSSSWAAFPDAGPVLKLLAPDFRIGVVSNSSTAYQRTKLADIGLLEHFGEVVLCPDVHGSAKPDPSIFLAGCAALGLPPAEVAYVGDNWEVDAVGSRAAGLRPYWLDRNGTAEQLRDGIVVINSLHQLVGSLNR
jgi:putative hydrolase of the HAD superfamily